MDLPVPDLLRSCYFTGQAFDALLGFGDARLKNGEKF
jgi:hypothetical protein